MSILSFPFGILLNCFMTFYIFIIIHLPAFCVKIAKSFAPALMLSKYIRHMQGFKTIHKEM